MPGLFLQGLSIEQVVTLKESAHRSSRELDLSVVNPVQHALPQQSSYVEQKPIPAIGDTGEQSSSQQEHQSQADKQSPANKQDDVPLESLSKQGESESQRSRNPEQEQSRSPKQMFQWQSIRPRHTNRAHGQKELDPGQSPSRPPCTHNTYSALKELRRRRESSQRSSVSPHRRVAHAIIPNGVNNGVPMDSPMTSTMMSSNVAPTEAAHGVIGNDATKPLCQAMPSSAQPPSYRNSYSPLRRRRVTSRTVRFGDTGRSSPKGNRAGRRARNSSTAPSEDLCDGLDPNDPEERRIIEMGSAWSSEDSSAMSRRAYEDFLSRVENEQDSADPNKSLLCNVSPNRRVTSTPPQPCHTPARVQSTDAADSAQEETYTFLTMQPQRSRHTPPHEVPPSPPRRVVQTMTMGDPCAHPWSHQ